MIALVIAMALFGTGDEWSKPKDWEVSKITYPQEPNRQEYFASTLQNKTLYVAECKILDGKKYLKFSVHDFRIVDRADPGLTLKVDGKSMRLLWHTDVGSGELTKLFASSFYKFAASARTVTVKSQENTDQLIFDIDMTAEAAYAFKTIGGACDAF